MDYETIKWELRENGIGIITLNRPDRLNAVSFQMVEELHDIADHLMINLDCRVLILKAEGRVFSAGTDLRDGTILGLRKTPEDYKKYYFLNTPESIKKRTYYQTRISNFFIKMRKISQPIICLVQGPAAGAGYSMALASDIRIASPKATFINAVINLGLPGVDVGNSYFLPRLIGMSRATALLYSGKPLEAEKALDYGLILKIVEESELFNVGLELAETFLQKSPLGLRMTKEAINLSMDSPSLETMIQLENRSILVCSSSKDLNEGSAAFLEKRTPKYGLR
jgi:enoyl-CoA hydratase/carnithine racemase